MGGAGRVRVPGGFRFEILGTIWIYLSQFSARSARDYTSLRTTAYFCLDTTSLRPLRSGPRVIGDVTRKAPVDVPFPRYYARLRDRIRTARVPLVSSEDSMKPVSLTYSTSVSIFPVPAVLYNLHRPSASYIHP